MGPTFPLAARACAPAHRMAVCGNKRHQVHLDHPFGRRALTSYLPVTACPSWLWQMQLDVQADKTPCVCLGSGGVGHSLEPVRALAFAFLRMLCGVLGPPVFS